MRKAMRPGEISPSKTVEALQKALDQTYRQLLETAKADWQHLFAGPDPADPFVTVRISEADMAQELAGIPRADFVPARTRKLNGRMRRHLG